MAAKRKTANPDRITIPARHARAAFVKKGSRVKVINTHGTQVVDCWAFNAEDTAEYMSMEHCRVSFERYRPKRGDTMVTNKRRPILKIVQDSANGAHDTLLAACDRYRYELLGCKEYHRNCTDNLWEAMIGAGYKITETPSPFNLWQNTPVEADGTIKPNPPFYKKGEHIVMRAEMDLVVCLSACPQDITSINGSQPRNAHFEIFAERPAMSILIENATVVTVDPGRRVLEDAAVFVRGDRIEAVGPTDALAAHRDDADTVIDARRMVVLPGFVSAHNHLGYAVFRGRAEDAGHAPTHRLYLPMGGIISGDERRAIGALAVVELLRGGLTTVLEMEEDAELFAPFIEQSGIRAGIGVMVNDLDPGAFAEGRTAFDVAIRDAQLEQAVGLAERWHGRADGRIQAVMAATGLSTSSPALLRGLREAADRLRLRVSIHLGFGERQLVRDVHGMAQFDYAGEHGMLGPDVVAVHCYQVDEAEIETLADSGSHLAHCPHMNQFRGEVAPIQALRERGMNVGLGIDNYFSDYFEVLRSCIASARIRAHDPEVLSAHEALELGTIHAARALALDAEIGSIEPGKKADLQLVDMRRLGLTPTNDPVVTLVYHGHAKDVDTVIVDGRVVVSGGRVRTADEDALLEEAGTAATAAWARFRSRYGGYVAPAPH